MLAFAGQAAAEGSGQFSLRSALHATKAVSLSDKDVIDTAKQACAAYDKQNRAAPSSSKYARRLAKLTKGLHKEDGMSLNFKVYLVSNVNAFALANGCVRVYSGLMDVATDDELMGVIGHEIGHVKLGHSKAKMKTAMLARAAREGAADAGGNAGELAASELGGLAEAFINAQFSQKEETKADEYGFKFMQRHGYDTHGMGTMLGKLKGDGGLLSSHPSSPKRVKNIEKMIAKS